MILNDSNRFALKRFAFKPMTYDIQRRIAKCIGAWRFDVKRNEEIALLLPVQIEYLL
jgi:hypothetical protein